MIIIAGQKALPAFLELAGYDENRAVFMAPDGHLSVKV